LLLTEQLEIAVPHRRNFAEGVNCFTSGECGVAGVRR
jgi:hypothetical protein